MAKTCIGLLLYWDRLGRTLTTRAPTMAATMTQMNIPVTQSVR
ncbi:MAG TPA: hypothetical protein VHY77_02420 [Acidimicrobiales bacterium]|nr:hypothetical protein [Acidimicrobiales bacterium]